MDVLVSPAAKIERRCELDKNERERSETRRVDSIRANSLESKLLIPETQVKRLVSSLLDEFLAGEEPEQIESIPWSNDDALNERTNGSQLVVSNCRKSKRNKPSKLQIQSGK